jgi:hypothetical protein
MMKCLPSSICLLVLLLTPWQAAAQSTVIFGVVSDETGNGLPGALVELRQGEQVWQIATDARGGYRFDTAPAGRLELAVTLAQFARARRQVTGTPAGTHEINIVLPLALSADVTVTGKSTFTNLADVENPVASLVGIAQSSSQGAITARQLDTRPLMRPGEVLESVPGLVISQHSGEGKANQYYLRGFNLDHGTDFSTMVAGMPVNLPTHGHGHGYSDLNFVIPELVSGIQFSKGPYFADQGDFATAGAANINYVNTLGHPLVRVTGGGQAFGRILAAAAPEVMNGHLLAAVELQRNDGPWTSPDQFKKLNAVVRYSRGDALNGVSATAMAYRGTWNSSDQVPERAVSGGSIPRFGTIDESSGGDASRFSGSIEWQRTRGTASTKLTAFGIGHQLDLFSNFTYFLDDPENGDQFHQTDRRVIAGGKLTHRRIQRWGGHLVQNSIGAQIRHDRIFDVGLFHTRERERLGTVREDAVTQSSVSAYYQNEAELHPRLRTLAGVRLDGYRFGVDAGDPRNAGTKYAAVASPKGGVVLGPWKGTELYVNAGAGFHSNDARGATITVDPATGEPAQRVTPLVKARGAEIGVRSVLIPRLQTTFTAWTLGLDSELIFVGDAGTTEAGRPSHRHGIEWANYYSPLPWLTFDADVSISRARFTDDSPEGARIPGAVETVVSAGATVTRRNVFGAVRWRYFGPRPLVEDNSVRSSATSLVNFEAGYAITKQLRLAVDVFNLLDSKDSDIEYFYTSRLPDEPLSGVADRHFHPTLKRTARVSLIVGF